MELCGTTFSMNSFKNYHIQSEIVTRKPGSPRQQKIYKCQSCGYVCKKHATLVLHAKEFHNIEL